MSQKKTVARNAVWNWSGLACSMIAGFIISPFLVGQLGEKTYALWILIASLTGYFGLLDLGTRSSVGRNVAFYRARDDQHNVNVMLSTSTAYLVLAGLVAVVATFALLFFIGRRFDVPADQVDAARLAILLVGLSLACALTFNVFDAVLWGFQRFDLLNGIDIVTTVIRVATTYTFLSEGYGITVLAMLTLLLTVFAGLAKGIACFWHEPRLRIAARFVTKEGARQIFSIGAWSFLLSVARILTTQMTMLLIVKRLSLELLTPYTIASRLVGYATSLVSSGTSVLTPFAAGLHAAGKTEQERNLFYEGGKLCLAFTLFFTYNFLILGHALIFLWMKGKGNPAEAIPVLYVQAIGETFSVAQLVTVSLIFAKGKPRTLALINMADGIVQVLCVIVLARPFGLIGVAIGIAMSATFIRGFATFYWGARYVGASIGRFMTRTFLPTLAITAIPALILEGAVRLHSPRTWAELVLYGGGFTALYLVAGAALLGIDRLREAGLMISRRLGRI